MQCAIPTDRSLTFSSGGSPAGRWAAVRTDPHPLLADVARLYQGFSGISPRRLRRRELPFGNIVVILNFGPRYRMIDRSTGAAELRGSFVAGLHDTYVLVDNDRVDRCMHVDLSPPGAYRVLGMPMHHFRDRTVELADVLGADIDRLMDRLCRAGGWARRFAILDDWLLRRLADARPASPEIAWAWRQIELRRGAVPIGDIAAAVDWSRKRLVSGFREQIGVPPKTLGRVLRFHHAVERLGRDGSAAAEVAAACGYADQAHMIREFRDICGLTPGAMAGRGWPELDSVTEP